MIISVNEVMTLTRDEIIALITHSDVTSRIDTRSVLYLSRDKEFVEGLTGPPPPPLQLEVSACRLYLQTPNSEVHANLVDKFSEYISNLVEQPACECKCYDGTTLSYIPVVEKLSQTPPQEYTMRGDVKPEFAEEYKKQDKPNEKWFNTVPHTQRGIISMRFTKNTKLWDIVVEHLHRGCRRIAGW